MKTAAAVVTGIGVILTLISVIWLSIRASKKQSLETISVFAGLSVIVLIVGIILFVVLPEPKKKVKAA